MSYGVQHIPNEGPAPTDVPDYSEQEETTTGARAAGSDFVGFVALLPSHESGSYTKGETLTRGVRDLKWNGNRLEGILVVVACPSIHTARACSGVGNLGGVLRSAHAGAIMVLRGLGGGRWPERLLKEL